VIQLLSLATYFVNGDGIDAVKPEVSLSSGTNKDDRKLQYGYGYDMYGNGHGHAGNHGYGNGHGEHGQYVYYDYPITAEPTPRPTFKPTPYPSPRPTPLPTHRPSPGPTPYPSPRPTPHPTTWPTPRPTRPPTPQPIPLPTRVPTPNPTPEPTQKPTLRPTPLPTEHPTSDPTDSPTDRPTPGPTPFPTPRPTDRRTPRPTRPEPSSEPTGEPTISAEPSEVPSESSEPSDLPSEGPTEGPTEFTSLLRFINEEPELSELSGLIQRVGSGRRLDVLDSPDNTRTLQDVVALVDLLSDPDQSLTIFAPNNAAFDTFLSGFTKEFFKDESNFDSLLIPDGDQNDFEERFLNALLQYHTTPNLFRERDLSCTGQDRFVRMDLQGTSETVCDDNGNILGQRGTCILQTASNGRQIIPNFVRTDITLSNGIIHIVNNVLIPSPDLSNAGCSDITIP